MPRVITEAVSARLADVGAVPRAQDLYAGVGTDFYERLVGPDRAEIREVLALARSADGPILDVAAGSGRLTIPLVRAGLHVTAIDLSDDMLAHLRRALPEGMPVECTVADMRDFALDRRFALVVVGATSITLLDREGRMGLYRSVRRHLADDGVFAFTLAGGASAERLSIPADQEIAVPGPAGEESYLFSQQIEEGGAARVVNWVRVSDLVPGADVTVLTSRLRVLDLHTVEGELVEAGFTAPTVSPVRSTRADDLLLLTTTAADAPQERGRDASA